MSLRHLFSPGDAAATRPEGGGAAKAGLEATFAELSARQARGEAIGQGELDDKLTKVQQVMLKHDTDGSGTFDIPEVEAIVEEFEAEKKRLQEAAAPPLTDVEARFQDLSQRLLKGEKIPQAELDEKLNPIQQVMLRHDADGSGSFSLREVEQVVAECEAEKAKVKHLGRLVVVLVFIVVLALASIFGVAVGANEASKESHVDGEDMTTLTGKAVRTDSVESFASIFDLGDVPSEDLAYLKTFTAYVDKTAGVEGSWVEANLQVVGTAKPVEAGVVYLTTGAGDVVKIDATAGEATLTTAAGAVHAVADAAPAVAERRRLDAGARVVRPVTKAALAAREEARRQLGFSGPAAASEAADPRRELSFQGLGAASGTDGADRRLNFNGAAAASDVDGQLGRV